MSNYWTTILEDGFEAYDGGFGDWQKYEAADVFPVIDSTIKHAGAKSVKFDTYGVSSNMSLIKQYLVYGFFEVIEFYMRVSGSNSESADFYIVTSNKNKKDLAYIFTGGMNRKIFYMDNTGSHDTGFTLSVDTWYKFKIQQSNLTKKFSLDINDVNYISDATASESTDFPLADAIVFYKNCEAGIFYNWIDDLKITGGYMGVIEDTTSALISTLNTELQTISSSFKVRAGYPHESASIPYSVFVNIIDMGHEEFGQGQRYKSNIIQNRKLLVRISVYTPKSADTTLYSDGIGTSSEQLYLDRILDRIQRCLMRYRNLNNDNVIDTTLRGISPLLFDENLNSFNKTMSYDIEYEERFEK